LCIRGEDRAQLGDDRASGRAQESGGESLVPHLEFEGKSWIEFADVWDVEDDATASVPDGVSAFLCSSRGGQVFVSEANGEDDFRILSSHLEMSSLIMLMRILMSKFLLQEEKNEVVDTNLEHGEFEASTVYASSFFDRLASLLDLLREGMASQLELGSVVERGELGATEGANVLYNVLKKLVVLFVEKLGDEVDIHGAIGLWGREET